MSDLVLISVDEYRSILHEEISKALDQKLGNVSLQNGEKLTLVEAAAYVCLPVPSFRVHQHKIGGVKIGRNWMFTKSELDRFIESNRRKTTKEIRESL